MNTVEFPKSEEVESEACAWIAMVDRGLSVAERIEFDAWLEQSSLHGNMLVKCASMFDMLNVLQPIAKLMSVNDDAGFLTHNEPVAPEWWWQGKALAASAIMMMVGLSVVSFIWLSIQSQVQLVVDVVEPVKAPVQKYQTAVGEISTVALSDGSLLQLNTDSEVIVNYSSELRHVELVRGEVFFDVAKNSNKPFVVSAQDDRVTAIGTAFSVDASPSSGTEVIVTEGKVKLDRKSGAGDMQYPEIFLTEGDKVVVRNNRPEVSRTEDADALLAWREGMVVFQGESLADVVREIDRYTPLSFKLMDQSIASISVGGFFKAGDLDQLLLVLERNFGVTSNIVGNEVLLYEANK